MTRTLISAACLLSLAGLFSGCEAVAGGDVEPKFSSLYTHYFESCGNCHAPDKRAGKEGIEMTLDFSTVASAHKTLTTGKASGMQDPYDACNGVPFISAGNASKSLLMAVVDQPTRKSIDLGASGCGADTITDMTLKAGEPPAGFVAALKTWIDGGAPND